MDHGKCCVMDESHAYQRDSESLEVCQRLWAWKTKYQARRCVSRLWGRWEAGGDQWATQLGAHYSHRKDGRIWPADWKIRQYLKRKSLETPLDKDRAKQTQLRQHLADEQPQNIAYQGGENNIRADSCSRQWAWQCDLWSFHWDASNQQPNLSILESDEADGQRPLRMAKKLAIQVSPSY